MNVICFPVSELGRLNGINERTALRRLARAGLQGDVVAIVGNRRQARFFSAALLPQALKAITNAPEVVS